MTGQDLKNSILQLAIQGKLVPQDPNDEPASVLLARIKEEKKKLIEEKKIKKEKPLPEITEDVMPFDIPESWEWCRLCDITELITKGSSPSWQGVKYVDEGILFVTSENVGVEQLLLDNPKYLEAKFNDLQNRSILRYGDILTNIVGASIGRSAVFDININDANVNQAVAVVRLIELQLVDYLLKLFNSQYLIASILGKVVETARPNVSLSSLSTLIIPLPPLSEQKRIVAKIEELMPLVEEYDKAQKGLDDLNSKLPEQLKLSILQEAIMGKLGTNDPTDEPASELLKRIRAEKAQLIKDKKIKKEKLLPEITDEEKPFDIPENWAWCRLGEIMSLVSGQDLTSDRYNDTAIGIPYITGASCFVKGKLIINRWTDSPTSTSHKGDLLITCKGTVGEMAFNTIGDIHIARQIMAISPIIADLHYIKNIITHNLPILEEQAHSMIPGISRDVLLNCIIPLPPLAEQHRIVEKLDTLLPRFSELSK